MGKSSRTPILAAGGIVIRGISRPLIAVVQRSRDNAWVLPKGKLKPNERPVTAARREATEETGAEVRVHEFLGVISYVGGSGPKIAHFWRMQALGNTDGKPMADIKAVEWLPLTAAITRLSLPHEKFFLRNVGRKALNRTKRRGPSKPLPEEIAVPAAGPASEKRTPVLIDTASLLSPPVTTTPRVKLAKPQPRWDVLARLTRRWRASAARRAG
jgi:8-oxo-dGTP diphosphatase